ncbi:MAG: YdcF family protein [Pyrinomonadaceae bacterium]|nr:YdcF family protein [Pyrinomonadaceae bacterium]
MFICVVGLIGSIILLLILLGHFLDRRRLPSDTADVALVFGTGLAWKAQTRWETAAHLFHRGMVHYIIVSGGVVVPGANMTEAEWFRVKLIERGAPPERILIEDRATNTAENAEFALPIIRQHRFKTVVLVMSDFEGIRAHLTAKRAWQGEGIEIYDYHAASRGHWSCWSWWLTGEGWHLTWYTVPRLFRYRLWKYLCLVG